MRQKQSNNRASEWSQEEIPVNSPLGNRLQSWHELSKYRGKDKKKMIKYCCFIWGEKTSEEEAQSGPNMVPLRTGFAKNLNLYVLFYSVKCFVCICCVGISV